MKRQTIMFLVAIAALAVLAGGFFILKGRANRQASPVGFQQGQPPPDGPGQFKEFRKSHQYAFQLMRLVGNIGRLEKENKNPLTQAQAKAILAILQPLRKQASLDETAAKDVIKALQAILTDKQRTSISALPPKRQFRRGSPSQGPPPSGPPPNPNQRPMGGFNPLNPPTGGPMGQSGVTEVDKLLDVLKKKSGGT